MSILALTSNTLIGTAAAGNIEYDGQFFGTDSAGSRAQLQRIVRATAVASTSGTSIDFTGIPAWAEKITVMFNGVSTNGSSAVRFQLGAGAAQTTGYVSASQNGTSGIGPTSAGFDISNFTTASDIRYGYITFVNINGNNWVGTGLFTQGSLVLVMAGVVALTGTLDRVRITTAGGTDAFDAGTVNIIYEG
jgi:hypothetical protein